MRKYLLSVILVLTLLALPVAANPQYRLVVDNVVVDKPVVIIDGVSYVPVRAIFEILGADVHWDGETNTISIKTSTQKEAKRPPIIGDEEFIEKINAALDLLEEKDFPHYVMVCENTTAIKQVAKKPNDVSEKSIASATTNSGILIHPELVANPKYYDPVFFAGILAHEACHNIDWRYKGETHRETEADAHELTVYNLINAPQWMKDWCRN